MREVIHYSDNPAARMAVLRRIRDRLREVGVTIDDECKWSGDIHLEVQIDRSLSVRKGVSTYRAVVRYGVKTNPHNSRRTVRESKPGDGIPLDTIVRAIEKHIEDLQRRRREKEERQQRNDRLEETAWEIMKEQGLDDDAPIRVLPNGADTMLDVWFYDLTEEQVRQIIKAAKHVVT